MSARPRHVSVHWSSSKDDNASLGVMLSGDVVWKCWCHRKAGVFYRYIDCQEHITAHTGWKPGDDALVH